MNFISLKAILLVQVIFFLGSNNPLSAQRITIPDVTVAENDTFVEVPIYINWPDSSVAMQLSLLWDENYLRFDTLKFAPFLRREEVVSNYNVVVEGELRVVISPDFGTLNIIQEEKDSLGFLISFDIIEELPGGTEIWFNPRFANVFTTFSLEEIEAILNTGSVTYPGRSVSNQNSIITASSVRVFPNPTRSKIQVTGLPVSNTSPSVQLYDQLGRTIWSGLLINGATQIPTSVPNGQYWLSMLVRGERVVRSIIVNR